MATEITDNTDQIIDMMEQAQEAALIECGLKAEDYAKNACPVDTGLLRNSITYALDGGSAAIGQYKDDAGKQTGSYTGQMPKEGGDGKAVYIGTNVEYAIYVHEGTGGDKKKGPRPFIRVAVANHVEDYKAIILKHLEDAN